MDPKRQENYLNKYDEKSLDKLQSKIVFNDPAYLYIFKKTEKVIAALYLVTNLISDNEPVKLQIRQISLKLLSDTLSFKRVQIAQTKTLINDLLIGISEIVSLLKIASLSNLISAMNYAVVQKELSLLLGNIDTFNLDNFGTSGFVLPQDFFNVPEPTLPSYRTPLNIKDTKGQQMSHTQISQDLKTSVQKDGLKDNRRETIVRLLKAGKPLGIKDFALEIKDCSEKTIQRELIDMVAKGVLKKTGERRWSVYSIL